MDQNKIGKFIASKRKERGLTQTELGEALGVSYKAVSKWENGKNMPDVALFKRLCKILNISLNELLTGEANPKENSTEVVLLNTIKSKQKMDILTRSLLCLVIIMILIILIIMFYVLLKPRMDIYFLNIDSIGRHNKEVINLDNNDIYFYGIDDIKFQTSKGKEYNFKNAIQNKLITVSDLTNYLEKESEIKRLDKYEIEEILVYKNSDYTIISCPNNDILVGGNDLQSYLKGQYCGAKEVVCYITRTFKVLNVYPDEDAAYNQVLVKYYQGPYNIIKAPKQNWQLGSFYEFTYYTYDTFKGYSGFNHEILTSVAITDRLGLDQKQERVCVTK